MCACVGARIVRMDETSECNCIHSVYYMHYSFNTILRQMLLEKSRLVLDSISGSTQIQRRRRQQPKTTNETRSHTKCTFFVAVSWVFFYFSRFLSIRLSSVPYMHLRAKTFRIKWNGELVFIHVAVKLSWNLSFGAIVSVHRFHREQKWWASNFCCTEMENLFWWWVSAMGEKTCDGQREENRDSKNAPQMHCVRTHTHTLFAFLLWKTPFEPADLGAMCICARCAKYLCRKYAENYKGEKYKTPVQKVNRTTYTQRTRLSEHGKDEMI